MKIIISHDIDHLSVKEHWFKDLVVQKYVIWSLLELYKNKITFKTFFFKMVNLFKKSGWNNLKKLLEFDKKNGVNPTFFVAVNRGKGLSYSQKQAKLSIKLIKKYGFDIGNHGIYYNNYESIKREYENFKKIIGLNGFGIRMHYLKLNNNTLKNIAKVGYLFDTTTLSENLDQQYLINGLTEIPFHIMEGKLLGPEVNYTLAEIKQKTLDILNQAVKKNKKYVGVLFHQRYFSNDFPNYKKWYTWLINYCKEKKYNFVNYKNLL